MALIAGLADVIISSWLRDTMKNLSLVFVMSKTVTLVVDVNLPCATAWQYWTEADKLAEWLAVKAQIDATVGGAYELFWEPEHPERNSTLGCVVSHLELHKKLCFSWKGPVPYADLMNIDPPPTKVSVAFEALSSSRCRITLEHIGWGEGARWQEARVWQENAWRNAFACLISLAP